MSDSSKALCVAGLPVFFTSIESGHRGLWATTASIVDRRVDKQVLQWLGPGPQAGVGSPPARANSWGPNRRIKQGAEPAATWETSGRHSLKTFDVTDPSDAR